MMPTRRRTYVVILLAAALGAPSIATSQSVCLPAPRLLTTMPMGGQAGTELEVTIAGQQLEGVERLHFSHPGIAARPVTDEAGKPVPNRFLVTIADDCPTGIHEARVLTKLGISSPRVFSVGDLPETVCGQAKAAVADAAPLEVNSVCNAVMTKQAVDHYMFQAREGQRVVIDCAAHGIDSKLKPVLIVADAGGADLAVERRGKPLDFTIPSTGSYVIKVHDLTYEGGPYHFYRLVLRELDVGAAVPASPATRAVSAFSWPPEGLSRMAAAAELEPNNEHRQGQQIQLPCDLAGSFYPAADVDTFLFEARQGEQWWIEVASERLGLPTDPSVVVQHVAGQGDEFKVTDVVELNDIASPVKVSSNGYSYDGPPYNAGSTDVLGKLVIQQDGLHRLQLRDLFGGTRNDPHNVYRLVIRRAEPDFALVAWALHMNLRNGDRNALSKPLALRRGATMPLEVVVMRRDGFAGEIALRMENLPDGVSAAGLTIPAGQSRGIMLLTADPDAPAGLTDASFYGEATIDGQVVTRPCHLATMAWPVANAWSEIPSPRLVADAPVSVGAAEAAPLTIAPAEGRVWEVAAGQKLSIPLIHQRRCEFSGANISLKAFGPGFERMPAFDAPLTADASIAELDLAALKTPPGDYVIAFYGSAVAKYRATPEAKPTDIVDIVVSRPITIRVTAAEDK